MNILFLDEDVEKSAMCHSDRDLSVYAVQAARMASNAHHRFVNKNVSLCDLYPEYRVTSKTNLWVAEVLPNYTYCVNYGLALAKEYKYRTQKILTVKYMLVTLKVNFPIMPKAMKMTQPPLNMIAKHRNPLNLIDSYRTWYTHTMNGTSTWTKRAAPVWMDRFSIV